MSTNMFLKIADVLGESDDAVHAGWCEIISWGHSFAQPTNPMRTSSGQTVEKCLYAHLEFGKYVDKATPFILTAVWGGKQFDGACIRQFRADKLNNPVLYLEITMQDVVINSYSITASEGSLPEETIGLSYSKIQYEYNAVDKLLGSATGKMVCNTDLIKNIVEEAKVDMEKPEAG